MVRMDSLTDPQTKPSVVSSIIPKCNSQNYNYNEITGEKRRLTILLTEIPLAYEKEEILLGDIYVTTQKSNNLHYHKNNLPCPLMDLNGCLKFRTRSL